MRLPLQTTCIGNSGVDRPCFTVKYHVVFSFEFEVSNVQTFELQASRLKLHSFAARIV